MKNQIDLRKVFVQLLFSLSIGQVALRVGDLIALNANIENYFYSYSHLFLCVFIITTSWVGWYNSKSSLLSDTINNVISWQTLLLFVDLYLVICYFIIVRGAETPLANQFEIPTPSSEIEVFWSMVIFISYFFWDIFTKIYDFNYHFNSNSSKYERIRTFQGFIILKRIWPTFICSIISIFIYINMSNETDKLKVSIIDFILLSLFLIFRGWKQEVKKEYKLHENQISISQKDKLKSENQGFNFPINVLEGNGIYRIKRFFVKVFPSILFIIFIILYYKADKL